MDQQLLKSYLDTKYQVLHPSLSIRIGKRDLLVDQFLMDNNAYSFAFITAENPRSELAPQEQNRLRNEQLKEQLRTAGYVFCSALGVPANNEWPAEKSLFVLDIDKKKAIELGMAFNQNAIVFGNLGQKAELLICSPTFRK